MFPFGALMGQVDLTSIRHIEAGPLMKNLETVSESNETQENSKLFFIVWLVFRRGKDFTSLTLQG